MINIAKQKELGLIPASWEISPRDSEVPAWDSLDAAKQKECSDRMAAFVERRHQEETTRARSRERTRR